MPEYIDRAEALNAVSNWLKKAKYPINASAYNSGEIAAYETAIEEISELPAADVREVVLCGECCLHTHCRTEDVFDFAGLRDENRFCSVGKRKTNGAQTMGGAEDG